MPSSYDGRLADGPRGRLLAESSPTKPTTNGSTGPLKCRGPPTRAFDVDPRAHAAASPPSAPRTGDIDDFDKLNHESAGHATLDVTLQALAVPPTDSRDV